MRGLKTVFVGGPIHHAIGNTGEFAVKFEAVLRAVHETLETRGYRLLSAHQYERFGELDVSTQSIAVCVRDFEWMKLCDAFVAVLPPATKENGGTFLRTDGTCIELGWASTMQKPTVLVVDDIHKQSHLVRGLSGIAPARVLEYSAVTGKPALVVETLQAMFANDATMTAAIKQTA